MGRQGSKTGDRGGSIDYPTVQNMIESALSDLKLTQQDITNVTKIKPGTGGEPPGDSGDTCVPVSDALSAIATIDTEMTECYTTRAMNEFVYVAGLDSGQAALKIYRVKGDGNFSLLSELILPQAIRRFILHGPYIFGCNDGDVGQNLISLSVFDPWNPQSLQQLDVGFVASGLDAQGVYVYVVGGSSSGKIAIVNVSDPSAMVQVYP